MIRYISARLVYDIFEIIFFIGVGSCEVIKFVIEVLVGLVEIPLRRIKPILQNNIKISERELNNRRHLCHVEKMYVEIIKKGVYVISVLIIIVLTWDFLYE